MHLIDLGFSFACGLSYWWVVIGFISDISGQICPLLKGRHQLYVMIHFHAAVLFIAFKRLIVMVSEGRALPRGSCVVVLWQRLGLRHTSRPPKTPAFVSEVLINPGWVSIWTKVKNRPSKPAPFSILTQCTSLCICPMCVCLCDINKPAGQLEITAATAQLYFDR